MADVFISYCRNDKSFLDRLMLTLKSYDLAVCGTCWSEGDELTEQNKLLRQLLPDLGPVNWASRSGQDDYGTWAEIEVKGVCTALRWIQPGSFMMGSPAGEAERGPDEHLHRVTLTQGFWLGETEVTQALWVAVVGSNPSTFKGEDLPVDTVSWDDVVVFLDKLNQRLPGLAMRLPTEAEWEYACRAGTETPFSFGQQIHSSQVNFDGKYPYYWGVISEYRARTVTAKSMPGVFTRCTAMSGSGAPIIMVTIPTKLL